MGCLCNSKMDYGQKQKRKIIYVKIIIIQTESKQIMKNGLIIDNSGTKRYYLNDSLHRENGPAIEYSDGTKFWFLHGKRHRKDGPAVEWTDGNKSYWINDRLHREDGPAVESADGYKAYYINYQFFYFEQDYWKEIEKRKSLCYILSNIKKELPK
jgi:hypothetical protein